ncbi:hypothetical protein BDN67DRAFT_978047 [Paxillus ammoniavirescens]|nr:hypothetical protein BDN67DRAFT_978047 [Paxillus ammoniavirescens]
MACKMGLIFPRYENSHTLGVEQWHKAVHQKSTTLVGVNASTFSVTLWDRPISVVQSGEEYLRKMTRIIGESTFAHASSMLASTVEISLGYRDSGLHFQGEGNTQRQQERARYWRDRSGRWSGSLAKGGANLHMNMYNSSMPPCAQIINTSGGVLLRTLRHIMISEALCVGLMIELLLNRSRSQKPTVYPPSIAKTAFVLESLQNQRYLDKASTGSSELVLFSVLRFRSIQLRWLDR